MIKYNLKLFSYNEIFKNLVNLDLSKKLPHNIILSGQEGIGKSTFALHFINYLFSKNEITKYNLQDNIINSESLSFKFINNYSHPNFYYVTKNDGKKNIEVDQIRQMINFLNKSSFNNEKKIIFIDGVEDLNQNSSNALLKNLEEPNSHSYFILTHNINRKILDTIKSRCLIFKLNFDNSKMENIIFEYFKINLYEKLNEDFKYFTVSPKFLINHIIFSQENKLDLKSLDAKTIINYILNNKLYKKSEFIANYFQNYIEIYYSKMYSKTKDVKYYNNLMQIVSENNLVNKFNLDLDTFFIKFENKYLNI